MKSLKEYMKGKRSAEASLSVEAAFVIPISFYVLYVFMYFFLLLHTEFLVYQGMLAVSDTLYGLGTTAVYAENALLSGSDFELSDKGIPEELTDYVANQLTEYIAEQISETYIDCLLEEHFVECDRELSCISGGNSGLDCSGSYAYAGNAGIVIKVQYTFNFPETIFDLSNKEIVQTLEMNGFYGKGWEETDEFEGEDTENEDGKYVYITKNGEVYHPKHSCTYISLNISRVKFSEIETLRNESGGKYYPCEYCGYSSPGMTVFVTKYGTRYHCSEQCSRISRDVVRITKDEAIKKGLDECSKCGED